MKSHRIVLILSILVGVLAISVLGLYFRFVPKDGNGLPIAVSEFLNGSTKENSQELLNEIRVRLEAGESMTAILKSLFPGHIVVASSGTYNFVPIDASIPKNNYTVDHLKISEDGIYSYVKNDVVQSKFGIDVSEFQGDIDWEKVKAAGVEYAFVRALYRGYNNGQMVVDRRFDVNVQGAIDAGLDVGVYVFSQAITETEAMNEAREVVDLVKNYKITLPIVYDIERVEYADARANKLTASERTDITRVFLDEISNQGYTPMLYHNMEMGAVLLDFSRLTKYDKWLANYTAEFYWPYEYNFWQYGTAEIDGIKGKVDVDMMMPIE